MSNETIHTGEGVVAVIPGGRYEVQGTGVLVVVGVTGNGTKRWTRVLGSTGEGRLAVEIVPREERVRVLCGPEVQWRIDPLFGGVETLDKTPVEIPARMRKKEPDDMRKLVRAELMRMLQARMPEPDEDEDDFSDLPDLEDDPLSGYEVQELGYDEDMRSDEDGEAGERQPRVSGETQERDAQDADRPAVASAKDADSADGSDARRQDVRGKGGSAGGSGAARRPPAVEGG